MLRTPGPPSYRRISSISGHGRDKFDGGTGAGLTIAKKIVERQGGRIWAESIHGEGSSFHFTLGGGNDSEERKTE